MSTTATARGSSRYDDTKEASTQGTVFHKTLNKATPLRPDNPPHTCHSTPLRFRAHLYPYTFEGDTEDASLTSHGDRPHTPSGEQNPHRVDQHANSQLFPSLNMLSSILHLSTLLSQLHTSRQAFSACLTPHGVPSYRSSARSNRSDKIKQINIHQPTQIEQPRSHTP